MLEFEVDAEGFETDVTALWTGARQILRQRVARSVGLAVKEGAAEIRANHTFQNRTGDLEKSVDGTIFGWTESEKFVGEIRASAKYASFVEYDTAPHLIVGNPFLAFEWKGVPMFLRYVNHPGTTGQPFMHLGYYKAERVLEREIEKGFAAMQDFVNR